MRIEGYLFIPYGGQFRFALTAHIENGHCTHKGLELSAREHDYLWDKTMRGRPTLHELTDEGDRRSCKVLGLHAESILKAFKQEIPTLMYAVKSRRTAHIPKMDIDFDDPTVEFVRAT